jgi:hypothetical protein
LQQPIFGKLATWYDLTLLQTHLSATIKTQNLAILKNIFKNLKFVMLVLNHFHSKD